MKQEDRIPDTEVLEMSHCESVFSLLKKSQLRWAGHVHRMADTRIPKQLLYGELACGSRKRGRPKLRYKDTLKASMKDCVLLILTHGSRQPPIDLLGGTKCGRGPHTMSKAALPKRKTKGVDASKERQTA